METNPNSVSSARKQIAGALVKAQRDFGPALKTNTNPHFRSKYAGLDACVEAVIDALNKHGLALTQRTHSTTAQGVEVETVLVHESGEEMSFGRLFVPCTKNDAQGYGSAITYARRYQLQTALGLAPEDDDGNAAVKGSQQAAQQPAKKAPAHSALKTRYRGFVHEANGCGDGDEWSAFMATAESIMLVNEIREKLPHIWDGSNWPEGHERPEEFEPLEDFINRRAKECAAKTAEYIGA